MTKEEILYKLRDVLDKEKERLGDHEGNDIYGIDIDDFTWVAEQIFKRLESEGVLKDKYE